MVAQPGLCRSWSETPKTGFLETLAHLIFISETQLSKHNSSTCQIQYVHSIEAIIIFIMIKNLEHRNVNVHLNSVHVHDCDNFD